MSATWRTFTGGTGIARAAPLLDNDRTGLLWFFGPSNSELTIKLLDGCTVNGAWWVFLSSSSTVEYEVAVTDTQTGAERRYHNPLGNRPSLVSDTGAFACASPAGASR